MTNIRYRADVDGLRAIAILSVLIFHLNPAWLPGGFLGVDIFFVISGYLITRILLRAHQAGNFSWGQFFAKRIKRIFPALFVVLMVSGCAAIVLLTPDSYGDFFRSARYASAQISNLFFVKTVNYFAPIIDVQPLLHTWSLAVEEQFYLIWPPLLMFCFWKKNPLPGGVIARSVMVLLGLSMVSFLFNRYLSIHAPRTAFYMFYTRIWEFGFGAILAFDVIKPLRSTLLRQFVGLVGVLLIVVSVLWINEDMPHLYLYMLAPCFGAFLLIYIGQIDGYLWVSRLLSLKPMVAIGLISYSLYLWHWPVIMFVKTRLPELQMMHMVGIVVLSLILSVLTFYLIERPARRLEWKTSTVLIIGLLMIGGCALLARELEYQETAYWRTQITSPMHSYSDPVDGVPVCIYDKLGALSDAQLVEICSSGDPQATTKILLLGDSHAQHIKNLVSMYSRAQGLSYMQYSSPGCPMLLNAGGGAGRACADFTQYIQKLLDSDLGKSYSIIIYSVRREAYLWGVDYVTGAPVAPLQDRLSTEESVQENFAVYQRNIEYLAQLTKAYGQQLVIVGQAPPFRYNPKYCNANLLVDRWFNTMKDDSCLRSDPAFIAEKLDPIYALERSVAADNPHVYFFDTKAIFANEPYAGKYAWNYDHLTLEASDFLLPSFSQFMQAVLSQAFN